jgi:transposase
MQINKTDQNDAEGLAQIVRTGWYRSVHVKSFDSHRARALLGARTQLIGMTTRLSNHIRGVLKTFGLLPGAMRGLPFDRKVEALLLNRSDVALIVRPMLVAWRQLREQIAVFDKAIRVLVRSNSACRLLMSVPGIGVLSALAYVSTVEDPARFGRSRSVGAHLGLTPRQYQSGEVDRIVRSYRRDPDPAQESFEFEGLGVCHRQAIGEWQSTGSVGQKALRYSAQCLAFGAAVPLVRARKRRLTTLLLGFIRTRLRM